MTRAGGRGRPGWRALALALAGALAGAGAGWRAAGPDAYTATAALTGADDVLARVAVSAPVLDRAAAQEGDPEGARALADRVSVARDGALMRVHVRAPTREGASGLANAIAAASVAEHAQARADAARAAAVREATRLSALQTRLYETDTRLLAARAEAGAGADPQHALQLAKARTAEARARVEQATRPDADAPRTPALERLHARAAEAARLEAGYRQSLGPRHPVMADAQQQLREARKALADEIKRTLDAARGELAQAEAAEAAAAKRAAAAPAAPDAATARLRTMESEAEAARAAYESALRSQAAPAEADAGPGPTVLAPASPSAATAAAGAPLWVALGAALGALLGGLAGLPALVRARRTISDMQPRVAHDEQAAAGPFGEDRAPIGASPTGETAAVAPTHSGDEAVPASSPTAPAAPSTPDDDENDAAPTLTEVADRPDSPYAVAIEDLAEAIVDEAGAATPFTVLVTSLAPRAGKSILAANLARAAADCGRRVLLIDANAAHPTLSLAFGLGRDPGLLRVGGRERPIHALDGDWEGGLFFLPVDTARNGAAPRLPADALLRFDGVVGHFDLVVIDGPAVTGEPSDAALAASADQILLVSPPDAQADPAWASALLAAPRDKLRELAMAA